MPAADLQRIGFPADEQIPLYDPPAWNAEAFAGYEGALSRYRPTQYTDANGVIGGIVSSPSGAKMLKLSASDTTAGEAYIQYVPHTPMGSFSMEFEWEFIKDADHASGGTCLGLTLQDENDYPIYFRYATNKRGDASKGWTIAHREAAGISFTDFAAAGPDDTGGASTVRLAFTASSDPGVEDDGTLDIYVLSESQLDGEIGGSVSGTWSLAASVNHTLGAITEVRPRYDNSVAGIKGDDADAGLYYRYLAFYTDEDPPCDIDDESCSWYTRHHFLVEKAEPHWDASEGKWVAKFSVRYPYHEFQHISGSSSSKLRMRLWESHADYLSERSGGTPTLGFTDDVGYNGNITDDGEGYYRRTLTVSDLEPDTPYWYDLQVNVNGTFYKSSTTDAEVNGCFRTPPAPGTTGTKPINTISSCLNAARIGPNELWHDGRSIPVGSDGGAAARIRWFVGDWGYADEHPHFDKSGSRARAAETVAQLKSVWFADLHAYHVLRCANKGWFVYVGDDHDRSTNDESLKTLREEDGSSWDRDRDTVDEAAWADNTWNHSAGIASANADYGFACAIEQGVADHYTITPRAFAANVMQAAREVWHDIMPDSGSFASGSFRFDPSAVDLYGANQGASSDTLDADDAQFRYLDIGNVRYVVCDTRLFMDRSLENATFFGEAKQWVKDVISNSTLPGLVFIIPGYVQGAGPSATLKQEDNFAVFYDTDFSAEKTEIFTTEIDSNNSIKWFGVACGDHHFVTIDKTINGLSSKGRWQIASGGTQGIRQDVELLDDTSGYIYTTDAEAGEGNTVRTKVTFQISNEYNGTTSVSVYRIADPSGSDNGEGLDSLASLIIKGDATLGSSRKLNVLFD